MSAGIYMSMRRRQVLLELSAGPMTARQVAERIGATYKGTHATIIAMQELGMVRVAGFGKRAGEHGPTPIYWAISKGWQR